MRGQYAKSISTLPTFPYIKQKDKVELHLCSMVNVFDEQKQIKLPENKLSLTVGTNQQNENPICNVECPQEKNVKKQLTHSFSYSSRKCRKVLKSAHAFFMTPLSPVNACILPYIHSPQGACALHDE